ncbi:beta-glucosidase [Streptomyces sp. yr375]|nr:glycoside hydrolase family 3 protein [Streptomyces sp. yr375]SEQ00275.1 beta-glucosidase [Streptomyces sp. yr375]
MAVIDARHLRELRPHGVGHLSLAWFLGDDANSLREQLAAIQTVVREVSPFGIGALVHNKGINGFLHASGSQFPTSWAQAATWNPELTRRAAAVTSAHMRDTGVQLLFSPVMDINRDPRWGRVHETYGEDPELAARVSVAFVRGVQRAEQENGVLATGKHFLGYGASEGALNQAVTQLGRRALVDEYAEPFRRSIAEAGLALMMNAYNEIDGIPATASRWLLTEFLRDTLGFDGLVVSDYDSISLLRTAHHTARTEGEAAVQALSAGLDVELPGSPNYAHLVDEVAAGRLDERVVDVAVAWVLAVKARTGLIPGVGPRPAAAAPPDRTEAAEVRCAIAARAMVLLQNDGTLPLSPGERRVVVVGPAADELRIHFGAYTSVSSAEMPLGMRAVMEGRVPGIDPATFVFTDIFQPRMPGMDPAFESAARKLHPEASTVLDALRELDSKIEFAQLGRFERDAGDPLDASVVEAAVADADVVVAVVGERTGWVGNNTAGEGQSTVRVRVRPPPQRRVVVRRLAGAHVRDAREFVQAVPVAGLVAVLTAVSAAFVAGTEGEVRLGDVAVAHDLHHRNADLAKGLEREARGEVAVVDGRPVREALYMVGVANVVRGDAAGLRVSGEEDVGDSRALEGTLARLDGGADLREDRAGRPVPALQLGPQRP